MATNTKDIPFTQEELKILCTLLSQLSYKLGDAQIILPIADKLQSFIDPEPSATEVKEALSTN